MSVFLLWHSYERESGAEESKLCGIYSTQQLAEAARVRLVVQPGFRDRPDAFLIDEYVIDQDHWKDGFVSSDET